jgi:nitrogen fixation NifU-like protein
MAKDSFDEAVNEINKRIVEDLRKKFSPKVAEFFENPRNMGTLEEYNGHAKMTGTTGDTLEMRLNIEKGRIRQGRFETDGCGHAVICGCIVTDLAEGKSLDEAKELQERDVLEALGGYLKEGDPNIGLALQTLRRAIDSFLENRGVK